MKNTMFDLRQPPRLAKQFKLSTLSLSMCLTMAQAAETEQSSTDENQQKS